MYGFFGIGNAGNEAMLRAFVTPIRQALGEDLEVVVAGRHPSSDYDATYGVRSINNLEHDTRDAAAGRWLRGLNPDDTSEFFGFVREVAEADVVVVGPGQYLVETGEVGLLRGSLAQLSAVVLACTLTNTPCYGLALACEPLRSPWSRLVIAKLLPSFAALTFRDFESLENLKRAEIEVPPHEVLGDLALAGAPAPAHLAVRTLEREGIPARRGPRLAVAPRRIYWLGDEEIEIEKRMAAAIASWLRHEDRDVLIVPQSVYAVDGGRDDDREAARRLIAHLPEALRPRVHCIWGEPDIAELEATYGLCDVTLSARLHGSVFSCKQGTPPVVLSLLAKMQGYFHNIGHPECLVDPGTSGEDISAKLEDLLQRREEVSADIRSSVEAVRATAGRYAQIAIELLRREVPEGKAWARAVLAETRGV